MTRSLGDACGVENNLSGLLKFKLSKFQKQNFKPKSRRQGAWRHLRPGGTRGQTEFGERPVHHAGQWWRLGVGIFMEIWCFENVLFVQSSVCSFWKLKIKNFHQSRFLDSGWVVKKNHNKISGCSKDKLLSEWVFWNYFFRFYRSQFSFHKNKKQKRRAQDHQGVPHQMEERGGRLLRWHHGGVDLVFVFFMTNLVFMVFDELET